MVIHTLVSSAVPQTSSLSKLKNKCGRMDGWGQICDTSRVSVLWFFLSSILICCRSPFVHSHCDLLTIMAAVFLGEMRPTSRQTDKRDIRADLLFVQLLRTPHSCVYPGPRAEYKVAGTMTATPSSPLPIFHNMPSDTNNPQKIKIKSPWSLSSRKNTIHSMIQSGSFI